MATGYATANLGFHTTRRESRNTLMDLLLRYEAWLDRRRTSRILYELDDHALHDIGLSRADVEGLNEASWQDHLPPPMSR
ncbi:DUF1127 domain-containing protein [Microvirga splendida]|uniref:DUF1127 domain-containing protein n=1 Tax=Microvirga splendida TaxID=2795727 RepID=A0ABS0Y5V0_9HYPH|nr:DUF1127 domain-containing protein [Microvirga splendida]MBJ6127669.1 DUF1127 domain-containing protein [Microvirga splendida]